MERFDDFDTQEQSDERERRVHGDEFVQWHREQKLREAPHFLEQSARATELAKDWGPEIVFIDYGIPKRMADLNTPPPDLVKECSFSPSETTQAQEDTK